SFSSPADGCWQSDEKWNLNSMCVKAYELAHWQTGSNSMPGRDDWGQDSAILHYKIERMTD
ncbi:MAG: hypothetical protein VXB74_11880, partial [Deltaproteobacteria bacterium]